MNIISNGLSFCYYISVCHPVVYCWSIIKSPFFTAGPFSIYPGFGKQKFQITRKKKLSRTYKWVSFLVENTQYYRNNVAKSRSEMLDAHWKRFIKWWRIGSWQSRTVDLSRSLPPSVISLSCIHLLQFWGVVEMRSTELNRPGQAGGLWWQRVRGTKSIATGASVFHLIKILCYSHEYQSRTG